MLGTGTMKGPEVSQGQSVGGVYGPATKSRALSGFSDTFAMPTDRYMYAKAYQGISSISSLESPEI
jgi:hypothetical protein